MRRALPGHHRAAAVSAVVALLVSTAMTAGCGLLGAEEQDPVRRREFLEPIRGAQEAGVEVYWMGKSFFGGSGAFAISGKTWPVERDGQIEGVKFEYSKRNQPGRGGLFELEALSKEGAAVEEYKRAARRVEGARSVTVSVGSRTADLHYLPLGEREVNQLWLFVDLGETVVLAVAPSSDTGVPGTDSNPLLEASVLRQTVAQYLRPYSE